jgi:hypothetical protein
MYRKMSQMKIGLCQMMFLESEMSFTLKALHQFQRLAIPIKVLITAIALSAKPRVPAAV